MNAMDVDQPEDSRHLILENAQYAVTILKITQNPEYVYFLKQLSLNVDFDVSFSPKCLSEGCSGTDPSKFKFAKVMEYFVCQDCLLFVIETMIKTPISSRQIRFKSCSASKIKAFIDIRAVKTQAKKKPVINAAHLQANVFTPMSIEEHNRKDS